MAKRRGNKEGSIYQRSNGKWRAQFSINGGRLSFTSNTQKEAQEWLRSVRNQVDSGLTLEDARMTFEEFLDEWLLSSKPRLTSHTWRTYCQLVRDYIGPSIGDIRLQNLTPRIIQQFYNQKITEGLGLRTAQKTHTVIHASLNAALKLGMIARNPDNATVPPKPVPKEMKYLKEEQVKKTTFCCQTNE
jgi:integrase